MHSTHSQGKPVHAQPRATLKQAHQPDLLALGAVQHLGVQLFQLAAPALLAHLQAGQQQMDGPGEGVSGWAHQGQS